MTLKEQNFGIEIELTGITREKAAQVIADYFGTGTTYIGTYYQTYGATDRKGRTWKAMSDSSIRTQRKDGSRTINASGAYSCEVVSPILQYDDLDDLQNIVRALRAAGAMANDSCGIHVHVDGANHTAESLTRLGDFGCRGEFAFSFNHEYYSSLEIGFGAWYNMYVEAPISTLSLPSYSDLCE